MIPLSPTEKRILELYDRGFTYKAIAGELGISINTVKTHTRRILLKTVVDSLRLAAWRRRKDRSG